MLIAAIFVFFALQRDKSDVPSSGYTYLKYRDGIYIGTEKTEHGNIKAEVTIQNATIKDIKLLEFPPKLMEANVTLKDEIPQLIYDIIQSQSIVVPKATNNSAYVLNKIVKAVRSALDQSLIGK
jgi:uncharacterized protein with FMN-binding domain